MGWDWNWSKTDSIAHTTAFVTPVVEHWLEREIAQWVHPMKDRSDDPSHHERMLLPRSYISLWDWWMIFYFASPNDALPQSYISLRDWWMIFYFASPNDALPRSYISLRDWWMIFYFASPNDALPRSYISLRDWWMIFYFAWPNAALPCCQGTAWEVRSNRLREGTAGWSHARWTALTAAQTGQILPPLAEDLHVESSESGCPELSGKH